MVTSIPVTFRLQNGHSIIVGQGGNLTSDLKCHEPDTTEYDAAIDGMESLILALACAGVDLNAPLAQEAVETAFESIVNRLL